MLMTDLHTPGLAGPTALAKGFIIKLHRSPPRSVGSQKQANESGNQFSDKYLNALTVIEPASQAFRAGVLTTKPQELGTDCVSNLISLFYHVRTQGLVWAP
jgi:hypothetical protein